MAQQKLNISTSENTEEFITIDGVDFPMRSWNQTPLKLLFKAQKMFGKITALSSDSDEEVSDQAIERIDNLIEQLVVFFLPGLQESPEVLAKISGAQRMQIVSAAQADMETTLPLASPEMTSPEVSLKSPDSSGSTDRHQEVETGVTSP